MSPSSNGLSKLGVSLIRVNDSQLAISGDMLFASATRLRGEGEKLLPGMSGDITVDLSQVGRVGSVGISVLLCWLPVPGHTQAGTTQGYRLPTEQ